MAFDPCNPGADACNLAQGLPTQGPIMSPPGTDDPEGAVTGYITGGQFYWRTSTSKLYVFGGVPRENTGWVILN
jgi:hypothetical protein